MSLCHNNATAAIIPRASAGKPSVTRLTQRIWVASNGKTTAPLLAADGLLLASKTRRALREERERG